MFEIYAPVGHVMSEIVFKWLIDNGRLCTCRQKSKFTLLTTFDTKYNNGIRGVKGGHIAFRQ